MKLKIGENCDFAPGSTAEEPQLVIRSPAPGGTSAHDHGNCELCDQLERALAAAQAENAALRREDYVLVPREPTRAQTLAGHAVYESQGNYVNDIYRAMLNAALDAAERGEK